MCHKQFVVNLLVSQHLCFIIWSCFCARRLRSLSLVIICIFLKSQHCYGIYWRQCGWSTTLFKNKEMSPFFVFLYKNKSFIPRWILWVCYLPLFTVTSFLLLQKLAKWVWVCSLPSCIPIPFCQKLKNRFSMHLSHVGICLTTFLTSTDASVLVRKPPGACLALSVHQSTLLTASCEHAEEGFIAGLQCWWTTPSLILTWVV